MQAAASDITAACPMPATLRAAVCPKGTFENGTDATSCTRCPPNHYCGGGEEVENPLTRGALNPCGGDLITRNSGARSRADCVAPAGYAFASPTQAIPCGRSEYAPQFNRLTKCMRCQAGLEEPVDSNLTVPMRATKRVVCSECQLLDCCLCWIICHLWHTASRLQCVAWLVDMCAWRSSADKDSSSSQPALQITSTHVPFGFCPAGFSQSLMSSAAALLSLQRSLLAST